MLTALRRGRIGAELGGDETPARRQRRWVLSVAAAAAVFSIGGVVGATFVQSPEQRRASAEPPARTVLTAEVEHRVLASTVVTRGIVGSARQVEATPALAQGATVAVVTLVRTKPGAQVKSGEVVLTVSGRPLIVLAGALPAYRDLRPGDDGADVAQLQDALRTLGHYGDGDRKGHFGSATKAAVRKLYRNLGFSVPDTGGPGGKSDKAALRAADDAVDEAERAVDSLKARIAAQATASPTAPEGTSLSEQLEKAQKALTRARQNRADLAASTGPMVPLAEVVFLPTFPAVVANINAAVGDPVKAPLITFATGELGVTLELQPEQATLLKIGMPVEILAESLNQHMTAKVAGIGALTNRRAEEGAAQPGVPYIPVAIKPDKPMPAEWNGLDTRVTITAAQTQGDVLVVPLSAVSAAADGKTTVTVVDDAGTQTRVEVRPGVSGDGFVEVSPVKGALNEADRVVVGK